MPTPFRNYLLKHDWPQELGAVCQEQTRKRACCVSPVMRNSRTHKSNAVMESLGLGEWWPGNQNQRDTRDFLGWRKRCMSGLGWWFCGRVVSSRLIQPFP